jgi:hypothetical protein
VYFHSLVNDARQLRFPRTESGGAQFHHVIKLNAHYLWGLHLMFKVNALDYVVTLEDDLEPSGDFLMWHTHMRPLLLSRQSEFFAVLAHPHGPVHDCNFIGERTAKHPAATFRRILKFDTLPQLSSFRLQPTSPPPQLPVTLAWG